MTKFGKAKTKADLVASLSAYVSGDDVELDHINFLASVRDRITDDLKTASNIKKRKT